MKSHKGSNSEISRRIEPANACYRDKVADFVHRMDMHEDATNYTQQQSQHLGQTKKVLSSTPPPQDEDIPSQSPGKFRGGFTAHFPKVLHNMLSRAEKEKYNHICSWQPHGRCFIIHDREKLVSQIMPLYFRQTRFASFQRQLNLYGFCRISQRGPDYGGYYHDLFLRGQPKLCEHMQRNKGEEVVKEKQDPNFYHMDPLPITDQWESGDYKVPPFLLEQTSKPVASSCSSSRQRASSCKSTKGAKAAKASFQKSSPLAPPPAIFSSRQHNSPAVDPSGITSNAPLPISFPPTMISYSTLIGHGRDLNSNQQGFAPSISESVRIDSSSQQLSLIFEKVENSSPNQQTRRLQPVLEQSTSNSSTETPLLFRFSHHHSQYLQHEEQRKEKMSEAAFAHLLSPAEYATSPPIYGQQSNGLLSSNSSEARPIHEGLQLLACHESLEPFQVITDACSHEDSEIHAKSKSLCSKEIDSFKHSNCSVSNQSTTHGFSNSHDLGQWEIEPRPIGTVREIVRDGIDRNIDAARSFHRSIREDSFSSRSGYEEKETLRISHPLISDPDGESRLRELFRELFAKADQSDGSLGEVNKAAVLAEGLNSDGLEDFGEVIVPEIGTTLKRPPSLKRTAIWNDESSQNRKRSNNSFSEGDSEDTEFKYVKKSPSATDSAQHLDAEDDEQSQVTAESLQMVLEEVSGMARFLLDVDLDSDDSEMAVQCDGNVIFARSQNCPSNPREKGNDYLRRLG